MPAGPLAVLSDASRDVPDPDAGRPWRRKSDLFTVRREAAADTSSQSSQLLHFLTGDHIANANTAIGGDHGDHLAIRRMDAFRPIHIQRRGGQRECRVILRAAMSHTWAVPLWRVVSSVFPSGVSEPVQKSGLSSGSSRSPDPARWPRPKCGPSVTLRQDRLAIGCHEDVDHFGPVPEWRPPCRKTSPAGSEGSGEPGGASDRRASFPPG